MKNILQLNLKRTQITNPNPATFASKIGNVLGSILDDEKRIIDLTNKIDDLVLLLDSQMDIHLEQHEKDFLKAYR